MQNVSNFSECSTYYIPSVQEHFKATNAYWLTLVCVGAVVLVLSIFIFVDTLRYVMQNASSRVKTYTAFVVAVYPVTCLVSYLAIVVPRSYLLSEALSQVIIMAGMFQLFCLFVSYCGGDAQLVKKVKDTKLSLKVGPCCCWPCCSVLPTFIVNKNAVKYLKLLVLQLPLIQGLVYFILLVTWAEDDSLYQQSYVYMQPVILLSMFCGIWGMLMTIKVLNETLTPEFRLVQKFGALQLVLILAKTQATTMKILIGYDVIPCYPPITPQAFSNLINNSLVILETVLLGFIARRLYKREVPDIQDTESKKTSIISTVFGDPVRNSNNNNATEGADNAGYLPFVVQ